jgi:copper(I)-binding protein
MHSLQRRVTACGVAALAALALAPFLWPGSASAADYHLGSLQIMQPWARAAPQDAAAGAAYMTVTNTGSKAVRLRCDRAMPPPNARFMR